MGRLLILVMLPVCAFGQARFVDVTEQVGINVVQEGATAAGSLIEQQFQRSMGCGAAIGDYDNDGDLDVYLVRGNGRPVLLRNNVTSEGRRFRDVTIAAGVDKLGQLRVAHFVDLDNDGWLDLVAIGDDDNDGPNGTKLYRNNGDGTFTNRTPGSNLRPLGELHCGASLADYDGDGLLDVYITSWGLHGEGGPRQFAGRNWLFRNLGDFTFEDVTGPLGLGTVARDSYTAIFTDFNNDLRPDLFVAQDHLPDKFYYNTPDGFVDASAEVNALHAGNDMGLAAADFDDDGDLDVFATNITDPEGNFGTDQFNALNVNVGTPDAPLFENQAEQRGVGDAYWGWGTEFTDVDLDGDLDIVVGTGFDEFVANTSAESPILETPTVLFRNEGNGQFTREFDPGLAFGWDTRGVIAFDYDRDGDEDLLLTNIRQPARLIENIGPPGNWLSVQLEQLPSNNRRGIGAQVYATIGTRTMRRDMLAGESYVAGGPSEVHFGLGDATVIDTLRVVWTDGSESMLTDVPGNQLLTIRQRGLCDCDADGRPDGDQITADATLDLDLNGVLDTCQAGDWDCNQNGVPDTCEPDCDGNTLPDSCERNALTDCDGDRVLDVCNLANGAQDCNGNGILDACEIASGTELDIDANGIPDVCELVAGCPQDELLGPAETTFGEKLAIAGDLLVVGQSDPDTGSVQVYRYIANAWQWEATLTPPDGAPGDRFGRSLATDGTRVLVGADFHQVESTLKAGAAYVFLSGPTGWELEQKLTAANYAPVDWFGRGVAIDGDILVVGAPGAARGIANSGTAYIYQLDPVAGWQFLQETPPVNPQRDDNVGSTLALQGGVLAVGGHKRDLGLDLADAGGVTLYRRVDNAWQWQQDLQLPLPAANDRFGWALALQDDLLVVSADRRDRQADNSGVVYIYRDRGETWQREATLQPAHPQPGDQFGFSIALRGEQLAIGAARADGTTGPGATYLYGFDGQLWSARSKWIGLDGATGDAVAIGPELVWSSAVADTRLVGLSRRNSDCNANGITDTCDLQDGTLTDADGDGTPDECCIGDFDADGTIGLSDLAILLAGFAQVPNATGQGDVDGDRDIDLDDLMLLLGRFGSRCL